jgi:anti-sigma regulatory factor (Ser/Thr protein kinase)
MTSASFTLTVSEDPRFVATVRALTLKAAETAGCENDEATRLAEAVEQLLTALVEHRDGGQPNALDVRYDAVDEAFSVEILFSSHAQAHGTTLERRLADRGELDAFRSLAPAAQFGSAGSQQFCRLTCPHPSLDG